MARLAAIEKGLYIPTQDNVYKLIGETVKFTRKSFAGNDFPTGALIDPCAGEGIAAAHLGDVWRVPTFGVEIHPERAAKAASRMTKVYNASYHQLNITGPKFAIMFLNPPYDYAPKESIDTKSMRQEVLFLSHCMKFLTAGGLLILVPPKSIITNQFFISVLANNFNSFSAFDYPEPERSEYNQFVLFCRKAENNQTNWGNENAVKRALCSMNTFGVDCYNYSQPYYSPIQVPETSIVEDMAKLVEAPVYEGKRTFAYAAPKYSALVDFSEFTSEPLMRPRSGHQAMLLAAGYLNGTEIDGHLLKGGSVKTKTVIERDNVITEREKIESHLSTLNLQTGELDSWVTSSDPDKTVRWFKNHGEALSDAILAANKPQFNGDYSAYNFERFSAPGILPGKLVPELMSIQKQTAAAILYRWSKANNCILSGEMGTSKTCISILAASLQNHSKKVIVVCPTHLISKWIREVHTITQGRDKAVTAKTVSDIDAFFSGDAKFLILSKETAKLGSKWRQSFNTRKYVEVIRDDVFLGWEAGYKTTITKTVKERLTCSSCALPISLTEGAQEVCDTCKQPHWQVMPLNDKGTKRWPLARRINRKFSNRYVLIADEAHMFARSDSDQGQAVHSLIAGATKVLAMTGTLYGGRASSIFHLLYRTEKSFRDMYKHNECAKFVEHQGLFEESFPADEYTSNSSWRRRRGKIKEIPGMNPGMIPMLLPYTIFIKLRDLEISLPEYTEHVELVEAPIEIRRNSDNLFSALRQNIRKNRDALSKFLMALLGYPDCPEFGEKIESKFNGVVGSADALIYKKMPKDERVVEIAKAEKAVGRKCCVFFAQTHRRDARTRVKQALEEAGLVVSILEPTVAADKREEWINKEAKRGFDVLLTNGRLVETGLDLLFANTIIQYGVEYNISVLRQSIRRSWRIGQNKPVKVYFLAYAQTMQERATDLIARKMRAAEMVDGDEVGGLAHHDEDGGDLLIELAKEAMGDIR